MASTVATCVALFATVGTSTSSMPVAQAGPRPNDAARLAGSIADRVSVATARRQSPNGSFSDFVNETLGSVSTKTPRNRYGPSIMGAALVLNGARNSRAFVARAGVRSILSGIRNGEGFLSTGSNGRQYRNSQYPFSMLGVVSAWPSMEQTRSSRFGIELSDRRLIRGAIRRVAPIPTTSDPSRVTIGSNRVLLEYLTWLEAIRFGFRPLPNGSSSVLRSPRTTGRLVGEWIRGWVNSRPRGSGAADGSVTLVSDAPAWPNAYLALSSALVARALRVTSPPLSNELRLLLRRAVRAARLLVSPDGDIAWAGRSNLQSWTLSMMAYAALAAAADAGISKAEAGRNRAFAFGLLEKLRSSYLRPDGRMWLVPGLALDPVKGLDGLDWYAAEVPYTGLTLLGLEWAAREDDPGPLYPEIPPSNVLWPDSAGATLAVMRTPGLWVGLRGASRSWEDARLDSGPIAVKQRVEGSWRWLLHPPPAVSATDPPSWLSGPVGPGTLAPVRVTGLERRQSSEGDTMSITTELPVSGVRTEVGLSVSDCAGLAISLPSLPEPVVLTVWLPGPRSDGAPDDGFEVAFEGGRAIASSAGTLSIGPPQSGSSHPSLSQVSFGFGPGPSDSRLDICLGAR